MRGIVTKSGYAANLPDCCEAIYQVIFHLSFDIFQLVIFSDALIYPPNWRINLRQNKTVTVDELRERFTHNDKDLETRYRDRVKAIVRVAIREARGQDFPQ
jgi:hypothetical protein